jgi:hypothetical protein
MKCPDSVELDTASLQHVFSFLSANDLVLSVKPLSKIFRQYVNSTLESKSNSVTASADVPSWALPRLGVTSLTYKRKKQLMSIAAKGGRLQTLRWARAVGCPWDPSLNEAAAEGGHLAVLRWLRQEGCPWGPGTCEAAARGGHLDVLQWALQNGCSRSSGVCAVAAASGKLEVLQCATGAMGVPGTNGLVQLQQKVGTFLCCNGQGKMGAPGMSILAWKQP